MATYFKNSNKNNTMYIKYIYYNVKHLYIYVLN